MGRPKRTDKEQSGKSSDSSHNPSQITGAPALPTISAQTETSVDFAINSDAWMAHDLDDTPMDPNLRSVAVQYLDAFDFALVGEAPLQGDLEGILTDHYLNQTPDLSSGQHIPAVTKDGAAALDTTESLTDFGRFPAMRQETMQELSDLNMQLSRQLRAVSSTANKYTIHPSLGLTALVTPPDEDRTPRDAVAIMMQGLQTYHRLLLEILGSTGPTHSAMYDSHENPKSSTTSLLSPIDGVDSDSKRGRKRPRSDSSVEYTALRDSSQSANLDMPTSLLLLSCHTNLMHLCRRTFAAIRAALLSTHRQINLFTISFLNIVDLSIPPDPDLQIIVLIQAVIRMIDRIGRLLGYPDDCEVASGSEKCKNISRGSAIPQRLLDLVLKSETCEEDPADRVGIQALREEIRGLHELVYKAV